MTLAAFLFAPLPGLAIYLLGRRTLRMQDDPDFTEKLWRHRIRVSQIVMVSLIAIAAVAWRWAAITLPLFAFCAWIGAFPLRKTVFAEEWTLGEYLRSRVRLTSGVLLFWIVVLFEPMIVGSAGVDNFGWVLAALFIWSYAYRPMFFWGLEAAPLTDPELVPRLDAIAAKSRARKPEIMAIGTPNAHFANAFASPHPKHPRVLLSRTLIRNLTPDELAAIFAHEVAHLEHFTPRRVRIAGWAVFVLIIVGALLPALGFDIAESPSGVIGAQVVWTFAILLGFTLRQRRHQGHETSSDLRAIELCGDPEAFIRALTKLHALGRMPRRWDSAREAHYSHPSLARRIQAIRKATGTAIEPPHSGEPVVVSNLTLAPETVTFPDGRTFPYSQLSAMHVRPTLKGAMLVARADKGKSWQTPIAPGDVAAVQAFLDRADLHFAKLPANVERVNVAGIIGRLLATATLIGAIIAQAAGAPAAIVALIVIGLPSTPMLVSMGVASILSLNEVMIVFGLFALVIAFIVRKRSREKAGRDTLIVVVVFTIVLIPLALGAELNFARLHRIGLLMPLLGGIIAPLLTFAISTIARSERKNVQPTSE